MNIKPVPLLTANNARAYTLHWFARSSALEAGISSFAFAQDMNMDGNNHAAPTQVTCQSTASFYASASPTLITPTFSTIHTSPALSLSVTLNLGLSNRRRCLEPVAQADYYVAVLPCSV